MEIMILILISILLHREEEFSCYSYHQRGLDLLEVASFKMSMIFSDSNSKFNSQTRFFLKIKFSLRFDSNFKL